MGTAIQHALAVPIWQQWACRQRVKTHNSL